MQLSPSDATAKSDRDPLLIDLALQGAPNHDRDDADLGYSAKMIAEKAFLEMLRDEGRRAASVFLDTHADGLGHRSTADLDALLAEC